MRLVMRARNGDKCLMVGIKTMALATIEILSDPNLLSNIKTEFEEKTK